MVLIRVKTGGDSNARRAVKRVKKAQATCENWAQQSTPDRKNVRKSSKEHV